MYKYIPASIALLALVTGALAQTNPIVANDPYRVELRIPAEGVFAGEEIDIEFRVADTRDNDPVMGLAGVPNAKVIARLTMPEMAGMPEMRPKIHSEGVPGDYGLTTFFPHGGVYALALEITPPGAKTLTANFKVEVKDERPAGKAKPKPYVLALANAKDWRAGVSKTLTLSIISTATKQVVKDFDLAHEMKFHLLVARSDFGWFLHEHPAQQLDGTWRVDLMLPTGGKYLLYSDVAPVGEGSMILSAPPLTVAGPPALPAAWTLQLSASDGDNRGKLTFIDPIPVGRSVPLSVLLTDASGQPLSDVQPWLGAMGHLMIFSQDGQTVVHSHPADEKMLKPGVITFNARFPRPGKYRAFCQFQRAGQIRTLAFTLEVKP